MTEHLDEAAKPRRCEGCSILVGPGYLSEHGVPCPDGHGILSWSCAEYLSGAATRGRDVQQMLGAWRRDLRAGTGAPSAPYWRLD